MTFLFVLFPRPSFCNMAWARCVLHKAYDPPTCMNSPNTKQLRRRIQTQLCLPTIAHIALCISIRFSTHADCIPTSHNICKDFSLPWGCTTDNRQYMCNCPLQSAEMCVPVLTVCMWVCPCTHYFSSPRRVKRAEGVKGNMGVVSGRAKKDLTHWAVTLFMQYCWSVCVSFWNTLWVLCVILCVCVYVNSLCL